MSDKQLSNLTTELSGKRPVPVSQHTQYEDFPQWKIKIIVF